MNAYERNNRIGEALKIRGIKQVELCEKTGLERGAVSNWVNQRWQPKQKALYLMARALNVSEMWLAGYDCPMERPKKQIEVETIDDIIKLLKSNSDFATATYKMANLNKENFEMVSSTIGRLLAYQEAMKGGKK